MGETRAGTLKTAPAYLVAPILKYVLSDPQLAESDSGRKIF
jgi:hypothetical protein